MQYKQYRYGLDTLDYKLFGVQLYDTVMVYNPVDKSETTGFFMSFSDAKYRNDKHTVKSFKDVFLFTHEQGLIKITSKLDGFANFVTKDEYVIVNVTRMVLLEKISESTKYFTYEKS